MFKDISCENTGFMKTNSIDNKTYVDMPMHWFIQTEENEPRTSLESMSYFLSVGWKYGGYYIELNTFFLFLSWAPISSQWIHHLTNYYIW